jgi:hypothetical protein
MANLSFAPQYFQSVIWVAKLSDGTILREWSEDGKETLFKDIPKNRLKEFHLVGEGFDYWFDCSSGAFIVDGRCYLFPLSGLDLNYGDGLIHFKDAFTEMRMQKTHSYDGFNITGYAMGWSVTCGTAKVEVIFKIPEKAFFAKLTFLDLEKSVSWKVKVSCL